MGLRAHAVRREGECEDAFGDHPGPLRSSPPLSVAVCHLEPLRTALESGNQTSCLGGSG